MAAIAALGFIFADMSHEALGHGTVAYLHDAKTIVLSYTYLISDIGNRWISAAGPAFSLLQSLIALLLLRKLPVRPAVTWFVFLVMAFGLLDTAGYMVYSGVSNSGDLSVAIMGIPHLDVLRIAMVITGSLLYWGFSVICGRELHRFVAPRSMLMSIAYIAPIGLMCSAVLLNPLGWKLFLISALPASAFANASMFAMPGLAQQVPSPSLSLAVKRDYAWIVAGVAFAVIFVFIIGPGLTLRHAS